MFIPYPRHPLENVFHVGSAEDCIPIFYDIYPGSVVDITTVRNTVDVLRSARLTDITFIMDKGLFSSPNIEYIV